ncbi:putative exported protein [Vibrio crassostreae]|nr:putative exported protein [Vibrio crassostreae]
MRKIALVMLLGISLGATASTLEDCAKLLPEGHQYKVEIVLDVDKTTQKPIVTGSLDVTGGADSPESFDIIGFVECAGPLIKTVKTETSKT